MQRIKKSAWAACVLRGELRGSNCRGGDPVLTRKNALIECQNGLLSKIPKPLVLCFRQKQTFQCCCSLVLETERGGHVNVLYDFIAGVNAPGSVFPFF